MQQWVNLKYPDLENYQFMRGVSYWVVGAIQIDISKRASRGEHLTLGLGSDERTVGIRTIPTTASHLRVNFPDMPTPRLHPNALRRPLIYET